MTDIDAVDPKSGGPLFYEEVKDGDDRNRVRYRTFQSISSVAVAAICLQKETKTLLREVFSDFFDFGKKLTGLSLGGSFTPFLYVVIGDMCFLQKVVASGGACKVKRHFCPYCKCDGTLDIF